MQCIEYINVIYADNTSILMFHKHLYNLVHSMNTEINLLSEWLKSNKLTLNIDKTYYVYGISSWSKEMQQ